MQIGKVLAALLFLGVASALGQSSDSSRKFSGKTPSAGARTSASRQSPLTKEQGEEILNELRLIRQALEDLGERAAAKAPVAARSAPGPNSERVKAAVSPGWYAMGRNDAPVVLIEFADYQCPFCRQFHAATFPDLKRNYIDTGKVRFVSRDLPLPFHPNAAPAALAARCAGAQGKYWEMREALMGSEVKLEQAALEGDAEALRLDMDAYRACVKDRQYSPAIQQDAADAQSLGIYGTPGFVVGATDGKSVDGVRLDGAQPYSVFAAAIDSALAQRETSSR